MAREQRHAPVLLEPSGALILALHVQPGAGRSEVTGLHGDAIKLRLMARAVDGRANAALRAFLADAFGVPVRNVTLVRGAASRDKVVRIEAPVRRPDHDWLA
ncbi:MAG TPA: DUF167 domain-containing protein [Casimicrobiaceae bacterium]|nr:DUF167 domain-containing protein [Casimicrobiaceae bacterium]